MRHNSKFFGTGREALYCHSMRAVEIRFADYGDRRISRFRHPAVGTRFSRLEPPRPSPAHTKPSTSLKHELPKSCGSQWSSTAGGGARGAPLTAARLRKKDASMRSTALHAELGASLVRDSSGQQSERFADAVIDRVGAAWARRARQGACAPAALGARGYRGRHPSSLRRERPSPRAHAVLLPSSESGRIGASPLRQCLYNMYHL